MSRERSLSRGLQRTANQTARKLHAVSYINNWKPAEVGVVSTLACVTVETILLLNRTTRTYSRREIMNGDGEQRLEQVIQVGNTSTTSVYR